MAKRRTKIRHANEGRSFGEWLRIYRRDQGLTLDQLAERAGTDKSTLSDYENGKTRPDHNMAVRVIRALGVPADPFVRALNYPMANEAIDLLTALDLARTALLGQKDIPDERRAQGLAVLGLLRQLVSGKMEQAD